MTDTTAPATTRRPWHAVVRAITRIEFAIGVICLVAIFVLVLFQAVQRYLPIDQIAWTGELSRYSLVWLMFSMTGILITTRGHIALEIVDSFHPMIVRVVQALALVIVAAIGVLLAIEAVTLIDSQGILRSPVLRMPMSWAYVVVLIGVVSTVARSLFAAVDIVLHGAVQGDYEEDVVA